MFSGSDVDAVQEEMNHNFTNFNDDWEMVHDLKRAHQHSYVEYIENLYRKRIEESEDDSGNSSCSVSDKIKDAFLALDNDMSAEAINYSADDEVGLMTSTVALSGSVAVIAHVDGPMLHIAGCGDCVAVLGKVFMPHCKFLTRVKTV